MAIPLGLLYASIARVPESAEFDRRRCRFILGLAVFAAIAGLVLGLGHRSPAAAGRALILGRYSPLWTGYVCIVTAIGITACAAFCWVRRLPATFVIRPIVVKPLVSSAKSVLVALGVWVIVYYVRVNASGQILGLAPSHLARFVPVRVDGLKPLRCDPEMASDLELLNTWFLLQLRDHPELREPGKIFVFPTGQFLYGVLGVSSYPGVHLWYHYGLSYREQDCDTATVMRTPPECVILVDTEGIQTRAILQTMPRMQEMLTARYVTTARFRRLAVLQLRHPLARPANRSR